MNEKHAWWFAIFTALAGGHPPSRWGNNFQKAYQEREDMKEAARSALLKTKEPIHACFRAPWWLLWAYAHWLRAAESIESMDGDDYDLTFEKGMNFRRYLAAWLWSVGVPQLSMTAADLEALHECTGVAPLPHSLLPSGHSQFILECFSTTKVDSIPAKRLNAATLLDAFKNDQ